MSRTPGRADRGAHAEVEHPGPRAGFARPRVGRGPARFGRGEGGQAVVLIAIVLSGLLVGTGLAIDAGRLFVARRDAQSAADAAAWAGAVVLRAGGSSSAAVTAATTDAAQNGYSSGVTVSLPPTSGTYSGNTSYIQVVITVEVTTTLVPTTISTVTARAVAGVAPIDQGYAVIALDTASTPGAVKTSPQGSLAVSGGGIMINSSSSTAGDNNGSVSITPSTSGTDVVGNVDGTWPNVRTGRPSLPDPFANFPRPDTTGMITYGSPVCCSLLPGIYTGDISGNNDWTLSCAAPPCMYVLKGAAIDLAGNSSLSGTGVTIFITQSSYPSSGGTCPDPTVKLRGNNASTLSAPTTGTYAGMLLYQDTDCAGEISVGGNGAISGTGTIYAPSAVVSGNGNNSVIGVSQVVAKRVDSQNADFTFTYSSTATAQPRIPALSE